MLSPSALMCLLNNVGALIHAIMLLAYFVSLSVTTMYMHTVSELAGFDMWNLKSEI